MKRLLIATDAFLPRWDGVARFLHEILPLLQGKYDITVLAPDYGNPEHEYKVKLIRFPPFRIRVGDYFPSTISIPDIIREVKKTDLVFVQSVGTVGIASILTANRLRKPILYYSHLIDWEVYPKSVNKKWLKPLIHNVTKLTSKSLFNKCTLVLVPNLETMELFSLMGITSKKRVVHLGVDTAKFRPPASRQEAKKKIGISGFVVGYVGRLGHEKDLFTLQRAFLRLRPKYNDLALLIVGGGREDIQKLFKDKKGITYAGAQKDPVPYFQAMDVHVLSSLEETTSLTTLEAMSCQVACIATEVGFVKEYLVEGKNGLFFPKKDAYALSKKIEMLKSSPSLCKTLGENARSTVLNKFSWENTMKGIEDALESL